MKRPEGISKEEWIARVRDRYEKEEEQERERKEASNGATTGFWRPTTTDEVHSPGRFYRMNVTTGVSEVFEPPGMTPRRTICRPRRRPAGTATATPSSATSTTPRSTTSSPG